MFPQEVSFPAADEEIIFRIRQLIGDEKEAYVDDVVIGSCSNVVASGTMYQLEEPKGYPRQIYVNGLEYITIGNPTVIGYKYLQFSTSVLVNGSSLTVIYDHFRHSDLEIIETYDTSATTYLTKQCNLSIEDLGIDLLVLATAYILLTKDLSIYIKSAVKLEDSDSKFDASIRPRYLNDLINSISKELGSALEDKTRCKMNSLPIYKIE